MLFFPPGRGFFLPRVKAACSINACAIKQSAHVSTKKSTELLTINSCSQSSSRLNHVHMNCSHSIDSQPVNQLTSDQRPTP